MAHAGTTRDLGLTRPTTNEKRPGWFRAPLMVAAAIALGLAVGTAAWTLAGSQSVSVANRTAYVAAIHEKIEGHQALVAGNVDRGYDSIEWQRTHAANAAAMGDLPFTQAVDNLSIRRGYDAMPLAADHRLDAIETAGGLSLFKAVDDLSIRRGYDTMPLAADVAARSIIGWTPSRPRAVSRSSRRSTTCRSVADTSPCSLRPAPRWSAGLLQGVVTQTIPTASTDPVGTAYTQGLLIGSVTLSVVAGADPVDTPWGPRPAGAGTSTSVPDTRGGVPSQIAKGSNWVRTPEGNRPLP